MKTQERRFRIAEVRAEEKTFQGTAVVYNAWSELLFGMFKEQILPGAFDECLATNPDIIATIDHDSKRLLGRTSSGTVKLIPSDTGISVEVQRGNYTYANDLAIAISRGDIRGMSFIFDVIDDEWKTDEGVSSRLVSKANIYEVSFVCFPAYVDTDVSMRSILNARTLASQQAFWREKALMDLAERDSH